jgi:hypothetical protein
MQLVDGLEWSYDGRWLLYTIPDDSGRPSKASGAQHS